VEEPAVVLLCPREGLVRGGEGGRLRGVRRGPELCSGAGHVPGQPQGHLLGLQRRTCLRLGNSQENATGQDIAARLLLQSRDERWSPAAAVERSSDLRGTGMAAQATAPRPAATCRVLIVCWSTRFAWRAFLVLSLIPGRSLGCSDMYLLWTAVDAAKCQRPLGDWTGMKRAVELVMTPVNVWGYGLWDPRRAVKLDFAGCLMTH